MLLQGKKILFLGDSITEGAGTSSHEHRYFEIIQAKTGAICKGYGVGGTRITRIKEKSDNPEHDRWFNSRIDELDKDADIIVIFGGTNDFGHGGIELGNIGDIDEYTFYGALNTLYQNVLSNFPNSKIVVATPIHRSDENEELSSHNLRRSTNLKGFVDIIKEVANKYSLYVIDLYNEVEINIDDKRQRDLYVPDGLHPSDMGNELIANEIIKQLLCIDIH